MPLYAGVTPVVEPPGPVQPVWSEDVGTINATWTDPSGAVWPLSDTSDERGWFTTDAIAGWGARPHVITSDPLVRGGEQVRFIRAEPARIIWPLHVWGEDHMGFVQRYRALRRAFMATVHLQQPGTLRVARPDGTAREIDCYYEEGFSGEPGENWMSANPVLTLFAPDGCWRDVEPVSITRVYAPGVTFLAPFPTISSSQVLGSSTAVNDGDVDAWPVWTVTGPMTSVVATNVTTGRAFTLVATLTLGQSLTITTQQPAVTGPAGVNLIGSLNWPAAYLWPLLPGANDVMFTVGGSGVGTGITLAFFPRYEGA